MLLNYGKNTQIEVVDKMISIENEIKAKIDAYTPDETAFSIGDLGDIIRKHRTWQECFPRVEPFYAVKCNDVYPVLRLLADMSLSFDCASRIEVENVLNLGVEPSKIIFSNTYKTLTCIKYAAKHNVSLMTFDCEDELIKIKEVYPDARLVLRINPKSSYKVKLPLGEKFGCHPSKAYSLFDFAKKLDLNIIGVSFHVGSGCLEAGAFEVAIEQARNVFDVGLEKGFDMYLLDIGGGFPGRKYPNVQNNISFEEIAKVTNQALDKYFPGNSVRMIAEPGQFYVASAFTIATNIIAKKLYEEDTDSNISINGDWNNISVNEPVRMYYISDGIYGCFNDVTIDPGCFVPVHFKTDKSEKVFNSIVWGPTCDALDIIFKNCKLPDLNRGDWIYFKDMGAYTFVLASSFNSIPPVKQHFICERDKWEKIYQRHYE